MDLTIVLSDLARALSNIYHTENEAFNVAEAAGLDTGKINLSGSSDARWANILRQAHFQGKLDRLLAQARLGYETYPLLTQALQQYAQWLAEEKISSGSVQPARRPLSEMTSSQRLDLADALLACPSVQRSSTRSTLVGLLPDTIQSSIVEGATPRDSIANILAACQNHNDGVADFLAFVRRFEGDSIPMRRVDDLVHRITHVEGAS